MSYLDPTEHKSGTMNRDVANRKRVNMHEGIADWCDAADSEVEPQWERVGEQMGLNMSDFEDDYR